MKKGEENPQNINWPVVETFIFPVYSKNMKKPHKRVRIQITIPSK